MPAVGERSIRAKVFRRGLMHGAEYGDLVVNWGLRLLGRFPGLAVAGGGRRGNAEFAPLEAGRAVDGSGDISRSQRGRELQSARSIVDGCSSRHNWLLKRWWMEYKGRRNVGITTRVKRAGKQLYLKAEDGGVMERDCEWRGESRTLILFVISLSNLSGTSHTKSLK